MASNLVIRKIFHLWFLLKRPMTLGVRILIENDVGEILLVRHTYVDGWYFPGGGVETGESQQQAAAKELDEEVGIGSTGDMDLLGVYQNLNASRRDHVSLFRCRNWKWLRAFKPNQEIAEIGFFSRENLPHDITPGTLRRISELYDGKPVSDYW